MTSRWPTLTDELLRDALTEEPRAGLIDSVFEELVADLHGMPQARAGRLRLPWRSRLRGGGPSIGRSPLCSLGFVAIVALLLALAIAVGAIVGSISRSRPLLGRPGLIAFDSGGLIFVSNPDGTGRRQLVVGSGTAIQPTFSPDGARLAWMSLDERSAVVRVFVANADGSAEAIAAATVAVARATGASIDWDRISWSPDGRRLAYTSPINGAQQIFVVGADGSQPHEVGDPALEGHDPAWSPDGTQIAFLGGHFDPDRGVFLMRADGSRPHRIALNGEANGSFGFSNPVWSPTGTRLAFSAIIEPRRRIVVVDLDTGATSVMTGAPSTDDWAPAWSPDGTRLAWHEGPQSSVEGKFVIGAPAGAIVSVLKPGVVGSPTWSPDGKSLIGYRADASTGTRDRVVVVDVSTGSAVEFPAQTSGDASWQWVAP